MASATITSAVTNIQFLDNVGYQFVFTGSPVGEITIEVSIDHSENSQGVVSTAGTWTALTLTPTASVSAAGNIYVDLNQLSAPWVRAVYTKTSGTGTLNAYLCAKAV